MNADTHAFEQRSPFIHSKKYIVLNLGPLSTPPRPFHSYYMLLLFVGIGKTIIRLYSPFHVFVSYCIGVLSGFLISYCSVACECYSAGSTGPNCTSFSRQRPTPASGAMPAALGECTCRSGYRGRQCNRCSDSVRFYLSSSGCKSKFFRDASTLQLYLGLRE